MESFNETIGERLRRIREAFRLTQHEMATLLFMQQANYSNIERGRSALALEHANRMINHFSINPGFLIAGREPMLLNRLKTKPRENSAFTIDLERLVAMQQQARNAPHDELREMINSLWDELVQVRQRHEWQTYELLETYRTLYDLRVRQADFFEAERERRRGKPN